MTSWRRRMPSLFLALSMLTLGSSPCWADDAKPKKPAAIKPIPESIDDLKAMQKQVKTVLEKVIPCTVGVRMGASQGSGVIISKDGYVLTAGHVSGAPNRDVVLIFSDGKTVKGKTLGGNHNVDSGLIKITEERAWPFVEMGKSGDLKRGQWCIAVGQPGGFHKGRTPPVRLGRIIEANPRLIRSDCTLVGGDSGGPLFDLEGKVIGIHSRISGSITTNIHVPVDTFRDDWDRLAKAEVWGGERPIGPYMGVEGDPDGKDCKLLKIVEGSPADKAGLKAGDVITKFNGTKIGPYADLSVQIRQLKVGAAVTLEVLRGKETVSIQLKLGRRPKRD